MLSIILPTLNEQRGNYLDRIVANLSRLQGAQLIAVDGGSSDGTLEVLHQNGFEVELRPDSTRAARLNYGLEVARGELIFLHHPRSLVASQSLANLEKILQGQQPCWGGLTHEFDLDHPLLRFTSWYSNRIRCDRRHIIYLDHCLFLSRQYVEDGIRVPDVEIFEDTGLSLQLRRLSKPLRCKEIARTSAIRFQQNGIYRQALLNQLLKLAFMLKVSPKTMNRLYEKGLGLNQ